jgi:hypothetical protein
MEAYQTKLPDSKLRGADNGDVPTKAGEGLIPSGPAPASTALFNGILRDFARGQVSSCR